MCLKTVFFKSSYRVDSAKTKQFIYDVGVALQIVIVTPDVDAVLLIQVESMHQLQVDTKLMVCVCCFGRIVGRSVSESDQQ